MPGVTASISTSTLSAGSAAFILIALSLGLLAQPRGSLVLSPNFALHDFFNTWRFSPLLCGLEALYIVFHLLKAGFDCTKQMEKATWLMLRRLNGSGVETVADARELVERPKLELIVPVILQITKLICVRGCPVTHTVGSMMAVNWVLVEYVHMMFDYKSSEAPGRRIVDLLDYDYTLIIGFANFVMFTQWFAYVPLFMHYHIILRIRFDISGSVTYLVITGITALAMAILYMYMYLIFKVTSCGHALGYESDKPKLFDMEHLVLGGLLSRNPAPLILVIVTGFVVCLWEFFFFYEVTGTYKPEWLDWMG